MFVATVMLLFCLQPVLSYVVSGGGLLVWVVLSGKFSSPASQQILSLLFTKIWKA